MNRVLSTQERVISSICAFTIVLAGLVNGLDHNWAALTAWVAALFYWATAILARRGAAMVHIYQQRVLEQQAAVIHHLQQQVAAYQNWDR